MKLARVGKYGAESPIVVSADGTWLDARSLTADYDNGFFGSNGIGRLRASVEAGELQRIPVDPLARFGSPIARPGAVICVGMNYAAHAAESGMRAPEHPVIFLKTPNTVGGPDDPVAIPPGSAKTDWEVELGIVIGRYARLIPSPSEALSFVAGFVAVDDLSERSHQLEQSGGQWSKGKCAPGFAPTGPWLVPPYAIDHRSLRMRSWVNGEPRQDSSTADMIFDVEYLVWHLSQFLALEPGDLVLTGTPEGVALSGRFRYLQEGDSVEIEIEGLGRQRHRMTATDPFRVGLT